MGHLAFTGDFWPEPFCEILGGLVFFWFILNSLIVTSISINTWLRVCKEAYINFGLYDYKLWGVIVVIDLTMTLFGNGSFSPEKYTCDDVYTNKIVPLVLLIYIVTAFITIVTCYIHVLATIRRILCDKAEGNLSGQSKNFEARVAVLVTRYVLVFIIMYTPLMVHFVALINCAELANSAALYALFSTVFQLGGIGNAIQYIINEGFSVVTPPSSNGKPWQTVDSVIELDDNLNVVIKEHSKTMGT